MNTLIFLMILIGVILAVTGIIIIIARAMDPARPNRRERELETQLDEVRELAYQYRDVDQGLAEAIIAKINQYHRKELS